MRNTARYGNAKEVATARLLEADGWLVGSRRHIGGAADLVATRHEGPDWISGKHGAVQTEILLVEVKARISLYDGFRRADRVALRELAERHGATPVVAWWKPRASAPTWVYADEWPD